MEGSTEKSGIKFTPYPGMIALAVPPAIIPGDTIKLTKEMFLKQIDDKAADAVTGELVVAATGADLQFVQVGDIVSLAKHSRVQKLIIDTEDPDRPDLYWIVRESEVLGKHDK